MLALIVWVVIGALCLVFFAPIFISRVLFKRSIGKWHAIAITIPLFLVASGLITLVTTNNGLQALAAIFGFFSFGYLTRSLSPIPGSTEAVLLEIIENEKRAKENIRDKQA